METLQTGLLGPAYPLGLVYLLAALSVLAVVLGLLLLHRRRASRARRAAAAAAFTADTGHQRLLRKLDQARQVCDTTRHRLRVDERPEPARADKTRSVVGRA